MMILVGVLMIQLWTAPRHRPPQKQEDQKQDLLDQEIAPKEKKSESDEDKEEPEVAIEATQVSPDWVTLGSMDPESPYRMLVTLTNQGAAVARVELNTQKYRDVQELSGYLGQIVVDQDAAEGGEKGVLIQVVGPGTPAHQFGLRVGDRIIRLDRKLKTDSFETILINKFEDLRATLLKTKPGDHLDVMVMREGREEPLSQEVILGHYPMDIIRPESAPRDYEEYRQLGGLRGVIFDSDAEHRRSDQLSFLTTLQQVDDRRLDLPKSLNANTSKVRGFVPRDKSLDIELPGTNLKKDPWEILSRSEEEVVFRKTLPDWKLEMRKIYRLTRIEDKNKATIGEGYHMTFKVELRNLDTKDHTVAYQLDGPTGLPLEGGWYSRKTGPGWSTYGIRDIVVRFQDNPSQVIANNLVGADRITSPWVDEPLDYIGVDSLYFQCTLKPDKPEGEQSWHLRSMPIRVGEKNGDWTPLTDISFRLFSREKILKAGEGPESRLEHEYSMFLGPKDTRILDEYKLGETISYGWFWFVAQPLLGVLHFFHSIGMNYAMAIIALTICVRLLMFPISRKQALGAIKMQQIQPELQAIAEKHKDDLQARSAAQSAVFKKHNYHPASGCLPLFIQIPIFIGLYKALSIDAGLYGTPMISSAIRWCSDLSAPDMLFDWSSFWVMLGWPGFNTGQGMFALGPYFNLLPMLTIVLFLVQQQIMMPPPTDDQSRMQRKMMQYMMIFMGFLFFKIPSGLCIYFIATTLWGLAERRFVPKPTLAAPKAGDEVIDVESTDPKDRSNRSKKKRSGQKKDSGAAEKNEGFFGKLMREVADKAAEQRKLEKTGKQNRKKKK